MNAVIRLEHIGLGAARDRFEETISFYQTMFGWHLIKESPGQLAFIGDGLGGRLEILPNDALPLTMPHHLAFVVELSEFDAAMARLREAGAPLKEPTLNPFGDRLVFFTDPSGNVVQIVGRREPLAP